jgi:hypothetical protein
MRTIYDTVDGSVGIKKCSKCGEWKAESAFAKNRTRGDGLQSECKACHNKRAQEERDCWTGAWRTRGLFNRGRMK